MRSVVLTKLGQVAGVVTLLFWTGCGTTSISDSTSASTSLSTSTSLPTTTLSSPAAETRALAQYWVGDTSRGFRLYREFARLEITPDPITAALRSLVSSQPRDSDYTSLWPIGTKINRVVVDADEVTIDLSFDKLVVGAEGESLAIAQIVWTATAADRSISKVRFTVDGEIVESLAGHVDASGSFVRAPAYEVVSPVWITSPEEGAQTNAKGFSLSGLASTFEANVAWKVFRGGKLIRQGSTTALGAAPAWTPWSVTIDGLTPGEYQFAAMEFSAKDGSLVAQDTKNVTLK
ncbi:MAG: GerMN domain-containing protein [Ilumatobacteraceae bacterium]